MVLRLYRYTVRLYGFKVIQLCGYTVTCLQLYSYGYTVIGYTVMVLWLYGYGYTVIH